VRLLLLLALIPSLAFGQVLRRDTGSGTFTTAPSFPGAVSTGTIQTKGLVSTAIATPVNATFVATTGTLNNGTYYYRVSAVTVAGETLPSTETSLAVSAGPGANGVIVNWGAVTGATSYKVYGRSTGAELLMATVTAPTTTWTDNGSVTPSGAMPTLGNSGGISTASTVTARDLTTTAASGAVGIQGVTGQKWCMGSAAAACWVYQSGRIATGNEFEALMYNGASGASAVVRGLDADDASGVALSVRNSPTLTTAGAKIATFAPDNANTVKASIDKDGMLQFGVGNTGAAPTCDATQRGKLWIVNGGTGVTDTVTLCLKAAADTYSWVAITTGG